MTIQWFKAECWCIHFRTPSFTVSRATACRQYNKKRDLRHHFHAAVGNSFESTVLPRGSRGVNFCRHNGFSTFTIAAAVQIWHCVLIQTAEHGNGARPYAPWRRCDHLFSVRSVEIRKWFFKLFKPALLILQTDHPSWFLGRSDSFNLDDILLILMLLQQSTLSASAGINSLKAFFWDIKMLSCYWSGLNCRLYK